MRADTLTTEFFIAALPPPALAQALHDAFRPWHASGAGNWDWKHPTHYHVTLGIAGSMPADEFNTLASAVGAALDTAPFDARLLHTGHFLKNANNRSNRHVLWAKFDREGEDGFIDLCRNVDKGLRAVHGGRPRTQFEPHLTVARPVNPLRHDVQRLVAEHPLLAALPDWRVDDIALMQRLPRDWQLRLNLDHRFHEIARLSLADGRLHHTGQVICALPSSPVARPA